MKRLFGAPKAAPAPSGPAPTLSEASGRIDARVTDLDTKIRKCDEDIRRYMSQGKGPSQKQLIMQCMKRKKMYEQQRDQIVGTQFNIDSLAGAHEQADITAMTVEAMKAGHQDLKQRFEQMGAAGDIERMMDGLADLHDEIAEINEAISTAYAVPDGFDETAFEAEFNAMEEEMAAERLAGLSVGSAAPDYLHAASATPAASARPEETAASAPAAADLARA
mmetsp:Transcript_130641/g.377905  ORF Transcript_130641/g.377905 Transcript_130641/m.377905 type:complete len:221 (+) Transcript_130641:78-740(+)